MCPIPQPNDQFLWALSQVLFPRAKLGPDTILQCKVDPGLQVECTHLRLTIFPDGGIMRFRALGKPVINAAL